MRVIAATLQIHNNLEIYFRKVRLDVLSKLNLKTLHIPLVQLVRSEHTDPPKANFSLPLKFGIS